MTVTVPALKPMSLPSQNAPFVSRPEAGRGLLEFSFVAGGSAVTRAEATNPLKLLNPRRKNKAAWTYVSTFGGGLVAGDQTDIHVRVRSGATGVISTQSSTKVYKSPNGVPSRQFLSASLDENATLVIAPDPVTCFADSVYQQYQRFDLATDSTLIVIDWLTSGRRACGERWDFSRYASRLEVFLTGTRLLNESLCLNRDEGALEGLYRLGRFNCLATVLLIGQRLQMIRKQLLTLIGSKPIEPGALLIDAISPIQDGVILRILADTPESVSRYLKDKLSFLRDMLGEAPWERKW